MRDYANLSKYLEEIDRTVYTEPKFDYHEALTDSAMLQFFNGKEFKDVLDVGFGTGYALNKFKELGMNVTGISLDDSEVQEMNFIGHNVKKMDMAFLDFPDSSFDLVWCRHTLEHSVMPFIALLEFKRVLRKCGYLYVELPADSGVHIYNMNHYSLLSDQMWQSLFKKARLTMIFRGQFTIHCADFDDIYWSYWIKNEA